MCQTPMGRPWDDAGEVLVVAAIPMQEAKECSDNRQTVHLSFGPNCPNEPGRLWPHHQRTA